MFATIAGASVTADGTNTVGHSGLARKAIVRAKMPLRIHANRTSVVVTNRCWMDHSTTRHFARRTAGLHRIRRVVARKRINMSLISWHSSRLKRVARSSSAAENQAAADGDHEAVYMRLCMNEVLFRQVLANRSATNPCRSGYGLSWCLRCIGSLFVL